MNKIFYILLLQIFLTSCLETKKISIKKVCLEEARKSVNLFHKTYPDKVSDRNQNEIYVSEYHTVYGAFFPLIDTTFKMRERDNNQDTSIIFTSNELKKHFPKLKFKKIEKEFKKYKSKKPNLVGCKIYNGFVSILEENHPFKPVNYLVFVEIKNEKGIFKNLYDNLDHVYLIENHTFDLREFSQKRKGIITINNYHLSCAPNCPKPDLISEN